jgi:Putative zinc-finger
MHDHFTEQLSAFADGELSGPERQAMEEHLAACQECRQSLQQLRAVSRWAPTYQGTAPSRDLWQDIERKLGTRPISTAPAKRTSWQGHRISVRTPLLAAAAVVLLLLGAGATQLFFRDRVPEGVVIFEPVEATLPPHVPGIPLPTTEQYDAAVAELEAILSSNDSALEPGTLRVIRESLVAIDKAIDDARQAIARDSTNDYLNASIAQNMRRKLGILRTAAQAATAKS